MKIFKSRISAGKLLANRLKNIRADVVLGIPRGGVVVASEIAKFLKLPLDIIITRKIGTPNQEELALGAVDPDGEVIWEEGLVDDLKKEVQKALQELKRREKLYRHGRKELDISGKTVILVDDGMATGLTTLSAIKYLTRHEVKVILAMPVVSQEALKKVTDEVEKSVVLEIPSYFQSVGQFYQQFLPVSDKEVVELLS